MTISLKDLTAQNKKGISALMLAATGKEEGHPEIVEMLLHAEKKHNSDEGLDLTDIFGRTALHYAAADFKISGEEVQKRKKKIYDILLQHGADPLKMDNDGNTPYDLMLK